MKSEISQTEENKYCVISHTCGIKKTTTTEVVKAEGGMVFVRAGEQGRCWSKSYVGFLSFGDLHHTVFYT